jgi:putative membrane protein
MRNAAKGGMMEVALGKLASEKGPKRGREEFGERMVTDHSKANDDLKATAEKKASNCRARSQAKSGN